MKYNLTEKLNFDENPKIVINKDGVEHTFEVDASATNALMLMDIIENQSEITGAVKCAEILIKNTEELNALGLNLMDYVTVCRCAMSLLMGKNPDEEDNEAGE